MGGWIDAWMDRHMPGDMDGDMVGYPPKLTFEISHQVKHCNIIFSQNHVKCAASCCATRQKRMPSLSLPYLLKTTNHLSASSMLKAILHYVILPVT